MLGDGSLVISIKKNTHTHTTEEYFLSSFPQNTSSDLCSFYTSIENIKHTNHMIYYNNLSLFKMKIVRAPYFFNFKMLFLSTSKGEYHENKCVESKGLGNY